MLSPSSPPRDNPTKSKEVQKPVRNSLFFIAIRPYNCFSVNDIQCFCCSTSMADVIVPGHGLMVQGELGLPPCEVITTIGICLCDITSFKAAYYNVALHLSDNAVATGSASIYVIMEEIFHSDKLKEGQQILCFIPESGRFSVAYMLLMVV